MKQERRENTINNEARLTDNLINIGTVITLSGIGVVTSAGAIGNPRILAAGGATMAVGLFLYSAGRLIHDLGR